MNFLTTKTFERSYKRLKKKYPSLKDDLTLFQSDYVTNHDVGVILGGGYRKIRLAVQSKGKGKRGGLRMIVYDIYLKEEIDTVIMVDIYDKSEQESLSDKDIRSALQEFLTTNSPNS
jgi:hypothetical protein